MAADPDSSYPLHEELLEHDNFVRNLARSLLFDENRVDDVVQETWLAALRNPPERSSLRGWLAVVVRNFAYKLAREEGRRVRRERNVAQNEALPSAAEMAEREAMRRRIIDAANELDEEMRTTVLLRYMEGLPPREIARRLSIPVETVRSRVRNIREQLRRKLDDEYGDRQAWCLALIPLAAMGGGSATAAGAVIESIASASTGAKVGAAAVVLAAAIGGTILVTRTTDAPTPAAQDDVAAVDRRGVADTETFAGPDGAKPEASSSAGVAVASSTGGVLGIRTLDFSTGRSLPDVRVDIAPVSSPTPYLSLRPVTTDDAGLAVVEDLVPGTYSVMAFHDDWIAEEVVVRAQGRTDVEIELETPACSVRGSVVDVDGRPVPDAQVWLYGDTLEGVNARREGRTDAAGEFALSSVFEGMYVGIRARGHAPSAFRQIPSVGDSIEHRLDFQLPGMGGAVEVLVVAADGTPVADAAVFLHNRDAEHELMPVETMSTYWLRTDANGVARADGLAADLVPLAVRAAGHGNWHGSIEIIEGETARTEVRLAAALSLYGTITDESGYPVAGARIEVVEPTFSAVHAARTDGDGAYRVEGIGSGLLVLAAYGRVDGEMHSVLENIQAETGQDISWNPTLVRRRPIAGVVEGVASSGGDPLCMIALIDSESGEEEEVKELGADGAFRFSQPLADDYELLVTCDDVERVELPTRFVHATGVRPGDLDLRLVVPELADSGASISGRWMGSPEIAAADSVEIDIVHEEIGWVASASPDGDGVFRVEPLQPGRYRAEAHRAVSSDEAVRHTEVALFVSEPADLAPGESWDLGRIRPELPGRLVVRLERPDGVASLDGLRLRVLDPGSDGLPDYLDIVGETAHSGLYRPGSYRLEVFGHPFVNRETTFTIEEGLDTMLDLKLEVGARVTCRVRVARLADAAVPGPLRATVRDEHGTVVIDHVESPQPQGDEYFVKAVLKPGEYSVELVTEDGAAGHHAFEIVAGRSHQIIEIALP